MLNSEDLSSHYSHFPMERTEVGEGTGLSEVTQQRIDTQVLKIGLPG